MDSYKVPAGPLETTLEIKRSRFISCIEHTRGVDAASIFIEATRKRYPDANHHCYAYIAGAPDDIYQVDKSDDGEPRGTAGKPMLNVLAHSGVGEITVVVVRYFGGIKLGAGGLVRAYSQSVSAAMGALETREFVRKTTLEIWLPYSLLDRLQHWLNSTSVDILEKRFDINVHLTLAVPTSEFDATLAALQELGQGAIQWQSDDAPRAGD